MLKYSNSTYVYIVTENSFRLGCDDMAKISDHNLIPDSLSCWFFTIVSEQYSQTNFPIIKDKSFKVTKLQIMVDI